MDKIEKFFRKVSKMDRFAIKNAMIILLSDDNSSLDIKKLSNSIYYRARVRNFRILFYYDGNEKIVVKDINSRNDNTYKNLS